MIELERIHEQGNMEIKVFWNLGTKIGDLLNLTFLFSTKKLENGYLRIFLQC